MFAELTSMTFSEFVSAAISAVMVALCALLGALQAYRWGEKYASLEARGKILQLEHKITELEQDRICRLNGVRETLDEYEKRRNTIR